MKAAFCYFSGTGNSLFAAQMINRVLGGKADILPMAKVMENTDILENYDTIGIFYPTYAFGCPEIVLDFVDAMPVFEEDKYVFAITTCAFYAGDSLIALDRQLEKNGLDMNYGESVVMPNSYTTLMPAQSAEAVEKSLTNAEKKLRAMARDILGKKKNKPSKGALGLFSPINKAFMSEGETRDRKFILTRSCIGCGKCEQMCPVGNIKIVNGKPTFGGNCVFCLGCFNRCEKGAINVGRATIKKKRYSNPRTNWDV